MTPEENAKPPTEATPAANLHRLIEGPRGAIYAAIPKITGEVAPISKDRKNAAQGYSFRGIDDVYAALNLLLAKHGVSIIPVAIEPSYAEHATKSGGKSFGVRVLVTYLLAASDGSSILAQALGEGMDSGDKAIPKALSGAFKTLCFQIFAIPTGEKVDAENDDHDIAAAPANKPPAKPAPKKAAAKDPAMTPDQVKAYNELGAVQLMGGARIFTSEADKKAWAAAHKEALATLPKEAQESVRLAFKACKIVQREPGEDSGEDGEMEPFNGEAKQ